PDDRECESGFPVVILWNPNRECVYYKSLVTMDINKILKSDYLDILFEGRNKSYGGYELRKNYPKRMTRSLLVLAAIGLATGAYAIVSRLNPKDDNKKVAILKEVTLAEPPPIDPKKPPPPPPPAPPPPVKPTVK